MVEFLLKDAAVLDADDKFAASDVAEVAAVGEEDKVSSHGVF